MLEILTNYFDDLTKLFSSLCLAKFLDTSAKSLFLCKTLKLIARIKFFTSLHHT